MCDELLIQVITLYAREKAMRRFVVSLASEVLPEETLQKNIDAFADELKQESLDALYSIQDTLFFPRPSRTFFEEMDLDDFVSRLKKGHI